MPIETGRYCSYCVTDDGSLQDFDTRFERMVSWSRREAPDLTQEQAEARTLEYMATLPAWRDHPRVLARNG
jgi:hypothetical protein